MNTGRVWGFFNWVFSFLSVFLFWGVLGGGGWVLVWFDLLLFSSRVWFHILIRFIGVLIKFWSIFCSRCPILKALIFWHCRKPFTLLAPQAADQRSGVLRRSPIYRPKWVAPTSLLDSYTAVIVSSKGRGRLRNLTSQCLQQGRVSSQDIPSLIARCILGVQRDLVSVTLVLLGKKVSFH